MVGMNDPTTSAAAPLLLSTKVLLSTATALTVVAGLLAAWPVARPSAGPRVATNTGDSPLHVTVRAAQPLVSTNGADTWAEVEVSLGERAKVATNQPVSVALVLDHSGSMAGNKLEDARRAAHELVNRLSARDEFALVSFETTVSYTALRRMDDAGRAAMHGSIDQVFAAGGTNISEALRAGAQVLTQATGVRRLVLVTDGHPTEGISDGAALADVVSGVHGQGVTVTALGVGADYDGMMMQHLAERGGGMYGYLADPSALELVLGKELEAARAQCSRNVTLALSVGEGLEVVELAGRLPLRRGRTTTLQLANLRAGEPTTVFARLRTAPTFEGRSLPLSAEVTWTSLDEVTHSGVAALSLVTVEDEAQAVASRESAVFERGVSAFASTQLVAAAAAFERGDTSGANSMLESARSLFGMSANALAGEAEVRHVRGLSGQSGDQLRHSARDLERKNLVNFGRENEGY
jgi:Ca-activated chloride channel family protein